jgi:hypothetical protein
MDNQKNLLNQTLFLSPATQILTRNRFEIQLGLNPDTALMLPTAFRSLLKKCDGVATVHDVAKFAETLGFNFESTVSTLQLLTERGLMVREVSNLSSLTKNQNSHLLDAQRSTGADSESIKLRSKARITIFGAGRLGSSIALLLGNSGFSNLRVIDQAVVTNSDLLPWGASRIDVGQRRDYVVQTMLERIHKGQLKAMRLKETRTKPSLIIYAPDPGADLPWLDPQLADYALSNDLPFLVVASSATEALITSIIKPGLTGCIRCYHQHQTDRDAAWPQLIAQLVGRSIADSTPTVLVLSAAFFSYRQISNWCDFGTAANNIWWRMNLAAEIKEDSNYPHLNCGCFWPKVNQD